jgi:hypothetical protein
MKQLKIVTPLVNTNNPFFTANFTESITISPNSRIWFDKISFNIVSSGEGGTIQLGDQVIQMSPNVINGPNSIPLIEVFLPAATYPSIDDLYLAVQRALNGVLYSNPTNVLSGKMPDTGLGFLVNPDPAHADQTEIAFVQSPCTKQINPQALNIAKGEYWWEITGGPSPNEWSLLYPTPLLAGALQCSTAVYAPNIGYDGNSIFVGLYERSGLGPIYDYVRKYGVFMNEDWTWRYYNSGELTEIPDQTAFRSDSDPPHNFMTWYIDPNDTARLKFGIFQKIGENPITQLVTSPNGTFTGYDSNINYYFGANGFYNNAVLPIQILDPDITYMPHIIPDNTGWLLQTGTALNTNYKGLQAQEFGYQAPYPTLGVLGPRRVRIDFSQALSLMQGLGFTTIVNNMVGMEGAIFGNNPVGFVNFFDLALDCYNFTLESYMSSGFTKGRVAAIGYFVPVPTSTISGQTLFYAENKQLTFIDIKNKNEQVIESLNFRLYNPQNPKESFVLSNVSFTLFIEGGNAEEDGILVRMA